MLKTLTFSLSLAVALGFCSMSKAGGLDSNCTTCGLASPQGGPYASGQGVCDAWLRVALCSQEALLQLPLAEDQPAQDQLPKIVHTTSYEWVLKKKHCFSLVHAPKETAGDPCAAGSGLCDRPGWRFSFWPGGDCSFGPGQLTLLLTPLLRSSVLASTLSSLPSPRPSPLFLPR